MIMIFNCDLKRSFLLPENFFKTTKDILKIPILD